METAADPNGSFFFDLALCSSALLIFSFNPPPPPPPLLLLGVEGEEGEGDWGGCEAVRVWGCEASEGGGGEGEGLMLSLSSSDEEEDELYFSEGTCKEDKVQRSHM